MGRTVLLLAVLLLAACAKTGSGGSPADGVVGEWEFARGTAGGAPLPQPAGARATLSLEGEQASGTSFCNHYFAGYSLDGDAILFDGIGGTEMACEPEIMTAESAYVTALGAVTRFTRDGEELLLTGGGVELRFSLVPPVPASELVGTDWVLESLIDGETVSSVVEGSTLRLQEDGTFTATTACSTVSGQWQASAGRIDVTQVTGGPGRTCPPEASAQDAQERFVLTTGFAASIEEDRLTALADDGRGLVYRAR